MLSGHFFNVKMEAKKHIGLKELRAGSSFKRCAVVDIVPTGSYRATLSGIGLYGVGLKVFLLGSF